MLIKDVFNLKNEPYWYWGIALFALFIELCFHVLLPLSISNDSYGYLHLSQHIGEPAVFERSVGYPIFLTLLGVNRFDTFIPVLLVQAAMAVAIPLIVFKGLVRFGLGYAVLGGLIACIYFYNFIASLCILTEPVYVFSVAIYAFLLVRYFCNRTLWNLLFVIASCWLIALIRVDATLYFLAFLAGVGCDVVVHLIYKNTDNTKTAVQHFVVAVVVFGSISFIQSIVSNRTSSIIWPHFVFNWVYSDYDNWHHDRANYGIVKLENGQATRKLFDEIKKIVVASPASFDTLKAGGSETIRSLVPEKNGQYSEASVVLLMNDLHDHRDHVVRSYWIEGIMIGAPHLGVVKTSRLLHDAIIEAFKKHPEVLFKRMLLLMEYWWEFMIDGIKPNDLIFPTAYHQQINQVVNEPPPASLRPGFYKQWAKDLYQHTGHDLVEREFVYPNKFPTHLGGAFENIRSGNFIGLGHYIGFLGMQILRFCWLLMMIGIFALPFFKRNRPLIVSLLCASIIPPVASVFMSELDTRHFLMIAPIQIVTAVIILYSLLTLIQGTRKKTYGDAHAK